MAAMMKASLLLLICILGLACAQQDELQKVTVFAWPMTDKSPQELAQISYNAKDIVPRPAISNYKVPDLPVVGGKVVRDLVRVGLFDSVTGAWRGVVTDASSFDTKYQQKIFLHLDPDDKPWHVSFTAYVKPSPTQKVKRQGDAQDVVPQAVAEIIPANPAPTPHLNKPVVLNPAGKVEEAEGDQKTFLQK